MSDSEPRKICPKCGKKMIKRDNGIVLTSYPAQYPWYWWCGCGHTEEGGARGGVMVDEVYLREWEVANDPS